MTKSKYFETKLNNKELIKNFSDIAEKIEDLRPLLRKLKQSLLAKVADNFDTEGEASGEKWQEWSEKYREKREKENKISKMCHRLVQINLKKYNQR